MVDKQIVSYELMNRTGQQILDRFKELLPKDRNFTETPDRNYTDIHVWCQEEIPENNYFKIVCLFHNYNIPIDCEHFGGDKGEEITRINFSINKNEIYKAKQYKEK